jgi:hypothetical protein
MLIPVLEVPNSSAGTRLGDVTSSIPNPQTISERDKEIGGKGTPASLIDDPLGIRQKSILTIVPLPPLFPYHQFLAGLPERFWGDYSVF